MEVVLYNVYEKPRIAFLLNKAGQVIIKKEYKYDKKSLFLSTIKYTDVLIDKTLKINSSTWFIMDLNGNLIRNNLNEPVLLKSFSGNIKSSVKYKYWNRYNPTQKTLHETTINKYEGSASKDIKNAVYIWKM